jgi:hypothetical protein
MLAVAARKDNGFVVQQFDAKVIVATQLVMGVTAKLISIICS